MTQGMPISPVVHWASRADTLALEIALDVGTVMIACVALGLLVDDSTHFLYRLREEADRTADTRHAVARAMNLSGRPIVFTSIVLSLGFLVLGFASFNPVINFGILASMVAVLGLVFDLVVLPALLGAIRPRIGTAQ
jgi:predicted RND superfamily exporter protein